MIVLAILIVFALLVLGSIARLIWSVWQADIQVESASRGQQLFGRSDKDRDSG